MGNIFLYNDASIYEKMINAIEKIGFKDLNKFNGMDDIVYALNNNELDYTQNNLSKFFKVFKQIKNKMNECYFDPYDILLVLPNELLEKMSEEIPVFTSREETFKYAYRELREFYGIDNIKNGGGD